MRSIYTYPFLTSEVSEVQSRLVPVDGQVRRGLAEPLVCVTGDGASSAEAVPLAARAPVARLLHQLQGERVLVPEAVITEIEWINLTLSLTQMSSIHSPIRSVILN